MFFVYICNTKIGIFYEYMNFSKEHIWVVRLKQGSRSAFNALYELYAPRLFLFCYKYCKSREDAEEIVQDVFVKLWQNKKAITNNETLKYWLYKVARNKLINLYRLRINSPVFEEYVAICNQQRLAESRTEERLEYDDFCKLLKDAEQHLSVTQQKVFNLSRFEQLSIDEISEKLSLSTQTVKNQLTLALQVLRKHLQEYCCLLIFFING